MIPSFLRPLHRFAPVSWRNHCSYLRFKRAHHNNFEALHSLRDQHRNDTAFIVATGPSLKEQNLAALAGNRVLSCSNLFLHPDIGTIAPAFHFFAPYHPPLIEANWLDWLRRGNDSLPESTVIVLGNSDRVRVTQSRVLERRKILYLHMRHPAVPRPDCLGSVPSPQSVPLMALPFALHLGASRIVLLGCDHTPLRDYGKTIRHFYQPESDSRTNASDGAVWTGIEHELLANLNLFAQYRSYARLAATHGVSILNGSPDSWLELFPRIDTRREFGI